MKTKTTKQSHDDVCCTACGTCKLNDGANRSRQYAVIAAGGILFIVGMIFPLSNDITPFLFLASYLLCGGRVLYSAAVNIFKGKIFDENFLMGVATVGAFAIGEYAEGAAVMLFYQIGELLQDAAVGRSRKSISDLMNIRPDYANLQTGQGLTRVTPWDVKAGDIIVVKAGEKIPLDGRVIKGSASVDMSALTGESMPRNVGPASEVLSGSINLNGVLTIEVAKPFPESTVKKILDLVENAGSKKAKTEKFMTKLARIYTPVVVLSALLIAVIPPLLVPGAQFALWINRALIFLVISCPCALVISIPLGYFGGIGGASRSGVLVKGSDSLDALNRVKAVVFDKTGTLTYGEFKVTRVAPYNGFTQDSLLSLAAHAESGSNHPIALSVKKAYTGHVEPGAVSKQKEIAGLGLSAVVDNRDVLAGNKKLMDKHGISVPDVETTGTVVYVTRDGVLAGFIEIEDRIKPDCRRTVQDLRTMGVNTIALLTGDNRTTARQVADKAGITDVYAGLLPHEKVERLESIINQTKKGGSLAFVGDGINDAPVLARADIGVAMGGLGSDSAIEAADVVLMTDEPYKLVTAILIAKKTRRIVWQNIIFSLSTKAVILALGVLGMASMWAAVFGDVGVTVLTVFNSVRAMGKTKS